MLALLRIQVAEPCADGLEILAHLGVRDERSHVVTSTSTASSASSARVNSFQVAFASVSCERPSSVMP
jgi:hypothetical protein